MRYAPLVLGFVLLLVGVVTDAAAWSYAGLTVFAVGAVAMFELAWRRRRHD